MITRPSAPSVLAIQFGIERHDVDLSLTEEPELASRGVIVNDPPYDGLVEMTSLRHPSDLDIGVFGADMWVQTRRRRRHSISGYPVSIDVVEGRHLAATLLDGLRQVRVFRAHVGTARGPGIVTVVTGSRGTRLEVLRQRPSTLVGEGLADEGRADHLAVDLQLRAVGLMMEHQLAQPSHKAGVHDADDNSKQQHRAQPDEDGASPRGDDHDELRSEAGNETDNQVDKPDADERRNNTAQ